MDTGIEIKEYDKIVQPLLLEFFEKCLPESGRCLDIDGRHSYYKDIPNYFKVFWCMYDREKIIGVVAVKELDKTNCELKSLYLLEQYHGLGHGKYLLHKAIDYAKENGYKKMYLDSLSTSKKAIGLYCKAGFVHTERYNQNEYTDVFMVLDFNKADIEMYE